MKFRTIIRQTGGNTTGIEIPAAMVELPRDFEAALIKDGVAKTAFDKLSYSHGRQHVLAIEEAKAPDTRARRIARAIEKLRGR